MTHRYARFRAMLALAATLMACGGRDQKSAPKAADAVVIQLAPEDVATVRKGLLQTGPRLSGTLEAQVRAVIRAEAGGAIVTLGPDIGQPVKKGQLLVRIEAKALGDSVRSAQAAVTSAELGVEVSTREVARTEELVKSGALAQRDLERAQSAAKAALAALGQARAMLAASQSQFRDATVVAPISGVVAARYVNQGDIVGMGAPLYDVIEPSSMRLSAQVATDAIGLLTEGKTVVFEIRGYPGQTFEGTIERIAPAADPTTRQLPLMVKIPNPSGKLVAGLYAEGRVAAEQKEALLLPIDAIDQSGDTPTVLAVQDGATKRVQVALGLRDERAEAVEVVKGLGEGDVVVMARLATKLLPGTKVTLPASGAAKPASPTPEPTPTTQPPSSSAPTTR